MEEKRLVSQDDVMDVMEMTEKLEKQILETIEGNQTTLALSALMSASINCAMSQCKTLEEIIIFRDVFMFTLDDAIKKLKINP